MVTVPTQAADDYGFVRDLVAAGMDCMRINCAHDSREEWERMVINLRKAERETGRKCRISMDLAGPKLRTGAVEPGPCGGQVPSQANSLGFVTAPARVGLFPKRDPEALHQRRRDPSGSGAMAGEAATWKMKSSSPTRGAPREN